MVAKVAVIIITYNAEHWIVDCLNSLQQALPQDSMVIIVDNGSKDHTLSVLDGYTDRIQLKKLSQNLGFGRANNVAFNIALEHKADYLFLLNQDTVVAPGGVTALLHAAEKHREYGIMSPLHLYDDNSLDLNFETYLLTKSDRPFSQLFAQKREVIEVKFVNAAAWLIPVGVLKQVGGFDPLFKHYGEDADWANRCRFKGYKIGVVPSAEIFHLRPQTSLPATGKTWIARSERRQLIYFKDPLNTYLQAFSKSLRWLGSISLTEVPFLRIDLWIALLIGWTKGVLKSRTARSNRKLEMTGHGQWLKM